MSVIVDIQLTDKAGVSCQWPHFGVALRLKCFKNYSLQKCLEISVPPSWNR